MQQIGLEAILQDKNFQEGLKRFNEGTDQMVKKSDEGASAMSRIGNVASGAMTAGLAIGVASIAAFVAMGKRGFDTTLAWGEQLDKLGDQFGMNAKDADIWATAMDRMGVSPEEGSMQLNFFTKQLDDVKKAGEGSKQTVTDNTKKISALKTQLLDANTQLDRAKQKFSQAKKPTQEMAWAVQDAQKKVDRLNAELKATPATTTKIKEAAAQLTPFQKALDKLGVSAFDAQGKTKTWDAIMPEIMAKFKAMPASVEASALAMDLFGTRGGSKFLDFLRDGNEALAMAAVRIDQFGGMTDAQVASVEQFGRATKDTEDLLRRMWLQIGNNLLPIVSRFVDYINKNVLPPLIQWAKDVMPKVSAALEDIIGNVQDVVKAFQTGDWSDVVEDVKAIVGNIVKKLQEEWPKVQKQLETWGMQFWDWLTNPNTGALAHVGTELLKLVEILKLRLQEQWPNVQKQLDKWRDQFWDWLTEPDKGAVAQSTKNLNKLTKEFEKWSKDPDTKKTFKQMGKDIADGIIAGIKAMFESKDAVKDTSDSIFDCIDNARKSMINALGSLGSSFASGVIQGILEKFMDTNSATRISDELGATIDRAIKSLVSDPNFIGLLKFAGGEVIRQLQIALNPSNMQALIDAMKYPFVIAWNWIATQNWSSLGAFVVNALKSGLNAVASLLNVILSPFAQAWNWVATQRWADLGLFVVNSISTAISNAAWKILDAILAPFRSAAAQIGQGFSFNGGSGNAAPRSSSMPLNIPGNVSSSNSSTVNNYFTLNNYSTASTSNIAGDFRILQSLAG